MSKFVYLNEIFKILNIKFIDGSYEDIEKRILMGGVMVVPAAPALATYKSNIKYYEALKKVILLYLIAALCLLLLVLKRIKVKNFWFIIFRRFINSFKFEGANNLLQSILLLRNQD